MSLSNFYTRYSVAAAVLFTVTAAVFLFNNQYANTWLLYTGNLLFSAVVLLGVIRVNHRVHDNASMQSLFMVGIKITFYAILIASVLTLIMLAVISSTTGGTTVDQSPSQAGRDTRGDLVLNVFLSAVMVNGFLGALASLIGSTVAKRNQKTTQGKTMY